MTVSYVEHNAKLQHISWCVNLLSSIYTNWIEIFYEYDYNAIHGNDCECAIILMKIQSLSIEIYAF